MDNIVLIILGLVIGGLLGTLLALVKMYNKQILELNKALMARDLTDYTVNTKIDKDKGESAQEPEIIPAEQATDGEFDHIIKDELNG